MLTHLMGLPGSLFWRGEWGVRPFGPAPLRPPKLGIAEPKE